MEREKLIHLVTNAQKGDGDALNELFNTFYNDVYYFALKTVKDEQIACDVTQETFIEIIGTLDQLREPAAFVKWMKQITYHQCTRYFKKKADVLVEEDEEGNTVFDSLQEEKAEFIPDEALDQAEFKQTIMAMIDELTEEQRAAVMMFYFDEFSIKQIAEIQGVSENTVKSRLNYARKGIKKSVEDYEKKNGIKLRCVGVLPFLAWLFRDYFAQSIPASATAVANGVTAATGTAVGVSAAAAASASVTAAATATAGIGAKLAALPFVTKIITGVLAASLVIGGTTAAFMLSGEDEEKTDDPSGIVSDGETEDDDSSDAENGDGDNDTSEHTHAWSEWEISQQPFGVLTIETRTRSCNTCYLVEKQSDADNAYEFCGKYFTIGYGEFLDRYFEAASKADGSFDISGLFAAGDFLVSREQYENNGEETTQVTADAYYEKLKEYFVLSDETVAAMKSVRPQDIYTVAFSYHGSNLMESSVVSLGENIYKIYYTAGGSHASYMPVFCAEVEYNRHKGGENKIRSLTTDGVVYYDFSRVEEKSLSKENLVLNIFAALYKVQLHSAGDSLALPEELLAEHALFDTMDIFGYNLTREEMFGKQWGGMRIGLDGDTLKAITCRWDLPAEPYFEDPTDTLVAAAKKDIEKFLLLLGEDVTLSTRIGTKDAESRKGIDSVTDDVIREIVSNWFSDKSICIFTDPPIVVEGKTCHFSFSIESSQSFCESAYSISLIITFD